MPEEYFGDVVLYWGNSLPAKILRIFTGSDISHCAVRINKTRAESVELDEGLMIHDLENPRDIYYAYAILKRKGMTSEDRIRMKAIYDSLGKEYDLYRIWRLAWRHAFHDLDNGYNRLIGKDLVDFPQTLEDISTDPQKNPFGHWFFNEGVLPILRRARGFNGHGGVKKDNGNGLNDCSAFYSMLYAYSFGVNPIVPGVHYSQVEPPQLLNLQRYEIVDGWIRPGHEEEKQVSLIRPFVSSRLATASV